MTPFTTPLTYENIPLVVSGRRDAEDCWVEKVCVKGTEHDISDMLGEGVVERLAQMADVIMTQRGKEERADAIRERFEFERFARHL